MIHPSNNTMPPAPRNNLLLRRVSFPRSHSDTISTRNTNSHPLHNHLKKLPKLAHRRCPSSEDCGGATRSRPRRGSINAEQIAQRSSSKEVKSTLAMLEELCQLGVEECQDLPPPFAELEMLECLASDAYYRVIMTKCHGITTITKAMEIFPTLEESCQQILKLLHDAPKEAISLRSPIDHSRNLSPMEQTDPKGEDILSIIHKGCQLVEETSTRTSSRM
jgi:hypothetical protein